MAQPISTLPDGSTLFDDGSMVTASGQYVPAANGTGTTLDQYQSGNGYGSNYTSAGGQPPLPPDPNQALIDRQNANIDALGQQNAGIFGNLGAQQNNVFNAQNWNTFGNLNAAGASQGVADELAQTNAGLASRSQASADQATAANTAALQQYLSTIAPINASQSQGLADYRTALNSQPILTAGGYGTPVTSLAATARADPNSIAAQNQVLSSLGGWASGAHALTSQAAGAYANPQDVANQQMAANALQSAANGSKNVDFNSLPGISELYDVSQGSQDVKPGQLDPKAYASMQDALAKFTAGTNPEVTAQERFIYEQARLQQEQDERAHRAAILSNYRMRGMGGSGQEVVSSALAGQQTSENRLLSDLGAQANAITRAQNMLNGQANLSSAMSAQANQLAMQNQGVRVGALGQFVGIGADVEQNNMNRQLAAQEAASQAYATLRAQGFSEEFSRRAAADQMAQFNNQQELQATGMQGDLATNMRSQSFNEDFQTKSAADTVAMFNKEQSQISQRWQESYAAQQQQAFTDRQTGIMNATTNTNNLLSNNAAGVWNAGYTTNTGNNNITQQSLGLQGGFANNTANAKQTAIDSGINARNGANASYAQQLAAMTQLGLGQVGNNTNMTQLRNQGLATQLGYNASTAATAQAKQQYEDQNSFRFGLGGNRGLLGGNLIPGLI